MKKLWKWTKRITLGFLAFILLLIAIGAVYQYVATKIDARKYPPPGKMVDVGGYRLHLNCEGKGRPTVILDAGMGCDSLEWALVQPEIAKITKCCSYDRAGYAWSDTSPYPRTSEQVVKELHTLLVNAKISPPYILVGHSFGGMNAQLYAKRYPNEVVGLVLVDSPNENPEILFLIEPEKTWIDKCLFSYAFNIFITRLGVKRLLVHFYNREELKLFPKLTQDMILANQSSTKQFKAFDQEYSHLKESFSQLKKAHPSFGNLPLIVIKAGKLSNTEGMPEALVQYFKKFRKALNRIQQDLAKLSSKGKLVIAEKSGHMIPWEQPEIIVEAVKQMVEETRHENR